SRGGLAAARLADQTKRLGAGNAEANALHRLHPGGLARQQSPAADGEVLAYLVDIKQWRGHEAPVLPASIAPSNSGRMQHHRVLAWHSAQSHRWSADEKRSRAAAAPGRAAGREWHRAAPCCRAWPWSRAVHVCRGAAAY